MDSLTISDEIIVRISEILEQVDKLNRQIAFHKQHEGDLSTIRQYEYLRVRFARELQDLLREYHLKAEITVIP